ncbi:DUF6193 family natural product biosynthesis protein [Streptomyces adustus]
MDPSGRDGADLWQRGRCCGLIDAGPDELVEWGSSAHGPVERLHPSRIPFDAFPLDSIFVGGASASGSGRDTMVVDANDETCDEQLPLSLRPVLPDMVAARSRGPEDVVEARWQSMQLVWQWRHAAQRVRSTGCPYPGIVSLLKAAVAQPRLRRLYPFTSHFTLAFSSSTSYPWTMQAGSIEPLRNGRFMVRRRSPFAVIGEVETPEEAVALVLELLPNGPDPVVTAAEDEDV